MRKLMIVPALAGLFLLTPVREAMAWGSYITTWKAAYPEACEALNDLADSCMLCHGAGFSFNPYAQDLDANGMNFALVGLLDSDGDGRINDDEINLDCTEPGDAASPAEAATWGNLKALFAQE